jgi:hypothetical protein
MTYQSITRGSTAAIRRGDAPSWPAARHTVVAVFDSYGAAFEASTALRAAYPRLEPSVAGGTATTPLALLPATTGTAAATLLVGARDDRAVANALATAEGVRFVYRAGAWTNELVIPHVA